VILERDPRWVAAAEVFDISVVETWLDGRQVFHP
jgi:predicted amidohydrolase YtcJ